jgi:hypothetical protein
MSIKRLNQIIQGLMKEFDLTVKYSDIDSIAFCNNDWQYPDSGMISARLKEYGLIGLTYVVPSKGTGSLQVHICL